MTLAHESRSGAQDAVVALDAPLESQNRHPPNPVITLKKISVAISAVILLGLAALLLMLSHMGENHDALAAADSQRQFNSLLDLQSRQLATQTLDYAKWDEAIDAVLIRPNPKWWAANSGDYALATFGLAFSLAIDGNNKPLFTAMADKQTLDTAVLLAEPSFQALLRQARGRPQEGKADKVVATGLVHFKGQVHSVAAVRFLPEHADSKPHQDMDALLIFARSLPDSILPITAEVMGQPGLKLSPTAGSEAVAVKLALTDGSAAGFITWTPPTPGHTLVASMMPWIWVLFAVVIAAIIYAARRTLKLTGQIITEYRLRETLATRNRSILDAAEDGIIGIDSRGHVTFANPATLRILRPGASTIEGQELHRVLHPQSLQWFQKAVTTGGAWHSPTEVLSDGSGSLFPAEISITLVHRKDKVDGAVVVFRDITERRAIEDQIYQRANFDSTTGAPNRNLFHDRLSKAIAQAQETNSAGCVMLLDIDRFKKVNDSMGHEAGDLLLAQVYERLSRCVSDYDTVARMGGDEFVVLLPRITTAAEAQNTAAKLLKALNDSFDLQGHTVWTGGSLGIVFYPAEGATAADVLRHAEMAMYRAKQDGRNNYHFYEQAMADHILEYRQLETALRLALEQQHFVLYYQPILELKTQRLSHLEALVRWRDPQRGLISPDTFIPLAEETGLIVDIGAWVLNESCSQLASWHADGLSREVGIAVNISGRQVPRGLPVATVAEILSRHGIAGTQLNFEITESVLFDQSPAVMEWLHGIRELGITMMIDDFGTGYSSLSYLKHFRTGALKIDKSFISDVVKGPKDQSVVRAILAMAHSLNLPVVAEGVETVEQAQWLAEHHCEYVQGYLFGRPLPAHEASQAFAHKITPTLN